MGDPIEKYSPIVFITGTGRSGTNITKSILSQHSDVFALPFEHRFTIDPRGVLDFYLTYPAMWSPYWCDYKIKDFISFLRSIGSESDDKRTIAAQAKHIDPTGLVLTPPPYAGWALNQWFPNYDDAVNQLESELVTFKYNGRWPGSEGGIANNKMWFSEIEKQAELKSVLRTFLEKLSAAALISTQKKIFIEDNTHSLLFANPLMELYPSGLLLHIVRDPRDVIASLKGQRWSPNTTDEIIKWYKSTAKKWFIERDTLDVSRWKQVRIEDIIEHPNKIVSEICAFIGVTFEERMLSVALSNEQTGRYKKELSVKEIQQIERELAIYIEDFGYK